MIGDQGAGANARAVLCIRDPVNDVLCQTKESR